MRFLSKQFWKKSSSWLSSLALGKRTILPSRWCGRGYSSSALYVTVTAVAKKTVHVERDLRKRAVRLEDTDQKFYTRGEQGENSSLQYTGCRVDL